MSFEEDHRVDGWPTNLRVAAPDEVTDEGELERRFQVAVEMILRDKVFQGDLR